jgi:hypothetical protein
MAIDRDIWIMAAQCRSMGGGGDRIVVLNNTNTRIFYRESCSANQDVEIDHKYVYLEPLHMYNVA